MVKWDLSDLYEKFDEKVFDKEVIRINKKVKEFEKYKKQLNNKISAEKIVEILEKLEDISIAVHFLGAYIELNVYVNTASQSWNAFDSKFKQFSAEIGNKLLFFSLWWKDLGDEDAKRIIKDSGKYKRYLEEIRKFKKYFLKENEERIVNVKNISGADSFYKIYSLITNAFRFDFDGKKDLTLSDMNVYSFSKDPKKREDCSRLVYERFAKEENVLGEIYRNVVLSWDNEYVNLRGYNSPISSRNLGNDVSDKSIDVLLNVCKKNNPIFYDFFRLKAKLLGMKKLRGCDYVVHVYDSDEKIKYKDAIKTTLEVFNNFDERFGKLAKKVVDEKHIHSDLQKGKRRGAFCCENHPGKTPFVFFNFKENLDDVGTIAHELGHAVHFMLSGDKTFFDYHASLTLAETASIFSEMLLFDYYINNKDLTKKEKINYLVKNIFDSHAAIARQTSFVHFEKEAHEMAKKGATIEEFNKVYLNLMKKEFGNTIEYGELTKHGWMIIPHIYDEPFYCYAYAFGNLLVLSLYNMYKEEGEKFIPKYLKILSYGGSESPAKILKEVGIDIEDEKFWQGGFDIIKEKIKELKKLVG